jgi:hypothetical protein
MVGPKPTMPSPMLWPSSAIQTPERTNNLGERTAEGLPWMHFTIQFSALIGRELVEMFRRHFL